jgi:hypothetical protein
MSLFNLNEVSFKEEDLSGKINQGNSVLKSMYMNNIFRFPEDIGNYDKGHYMIINIGQQIKTKYRSADGDMGPMTVEKNLGALQQEMGTSINAVSAGTKVLGEAVSSAVEWGKQVVDTFSVDSVKVMPLTANSNNTGARKIINDVSSQLQKPSFLRTVRLTTDTIALYMPDTLQFSYNQGYSDLSMNQGILPGLASAGDAGVSAIQQIARGGDIKSAVAGALKNMTPFIGTKLAEALLPGGVGTAIGASLFGAVLNPQLELLYSSPEFRTFRFEFMMYPRSQSEALSVQKIINRLRFHQAPELLQGGSAGLFLVPPSEFDISFYYNGQENPNIPSISTCVLVNIETDYAPNGQFAAYEVPTSFGGEVKLGGTGMPVGIRLSLTFKETQILTKFNYAGLPGGQTSAST